ncbi:MAG TPA: biotin transporter BioY [Clostridia bacterium]
MSCRSQINTEQKTASFKTALTALVTALTCSGGFIKIPLPMLDITLQSFFACMAGLLLGKKLGPVSQALYMLMGLIGIPVFARGGGITYVFQPSFGFILGFVLCSFICGVLRDKFFGSFGQAKIKFGDYVKVFIICVAGIIGLYLIGAPYMLMILRFHLNQNALLSAAASLPMYLAGDFISLIVLILAVPIFYKRVPSLLYLK